MEGAVSISRSSRVAVVTGGNKGIGLEVCRQLASSGITVVLTARDEKRGSEAVEKLQKAGLSEIIFYQLDVTDAPNIGRLANFMKARFGKLDILVNNAAVIGVEYVHDPVDVSVMSDKEFRGMDEHQMLEWLFKNIRELYGAAKQSSSDGRIVNVSSIVGKLRVLNEELRQELDDVENLTEERLDELLGKFLKDFEAGEAEARGWPTVLSAYKVSKTTMNSYSRILAKRHPELRVNCVHPGYVKTDMTLYSGVLTPAEGASNVTKVALLPAGGPTGTFFVMGEEEPFV
ncbi:hypothetical protein QOZ80_4BG0340400 [Eleusine coracana subsp. coracana]|nr:hypothetical protein QOZ80_4BG0340400 [Eleusine coracana subsp. coracana]